MWIDAPGVWRSCDTILLLVVKLEGEAFRNWSRARDRWISISILEKSVLGSGTIGVRTLCHFWVGFGVDLSIFPTVLLCSRNGPAFIFITVRLAFLLLHLHPFDPSSTFSSRIWAIFLQKPSMIPQWVLLRSLVETCSAR